MFRSANPLIAACPFCNDSFDARLTTVGGSDLVLATRNLRIHYELCKENGLSEAEMLKPTNPSGRADKLFEDIENKKQESIAKLAQDLGKIDPATVICEGVTVGDVVNELT